MLKRMTATDWWLSICSRLERQRRGGRRIRGRGGGGSAVIHNCFKIVCSRGSCQRDCSAALASAWGLCMLNGRSEFFLHQSGLFRIHQGEFHYGQLFTTSEQITQPAFSQRDAAKRSPAPGSYCKRCWINSVIEHINLLPAWMPIQPTSTTEIVNENKMYK